MSFALAEFTARFGAGSARCASVSKRRIGADRRHVSRLSRVGGRISVIYVLEGFGVSGPVGPLMLKGVTTQGIGVGHRRALEDLTRTLHHLALKPAIDRKLIDLRGRLVSCADRLATLRPRRCRTAGQREVHSSTAGATGAAQDDGWRHSPDGLPGRSGTSAACE